MKSSICIEIVFLKALSVRTDPLSSSFPAGYPYRDIQVCLYLGNPGIGRNRQN